MVCGFVLSSVVTIQRGRVKQRQRNCYVTMLEIYAFHAAEP